VSIPVGDRLCGLGDPTDTSIKLRPLEPASGQALARDLVLKTRRRKGLGDQIAVSKYLDDEFVVSLFRFIVKK
jgi:U5 small nuclear ribonucleoprotein component